MAEGKYGLKSSRMTEHDRLVFDFMREFVRTETEWDYKTIHKWLHENERHLGAKPLSLIVCGRGQELKDWALKFIEDGGQFEYYDVRSFTSRGAE